MISLAECIPTVAALARRASRLQDEAPSAAAVEEMRRHLDDCGYSNVNQEVYRSILLYGAAELENKNRRGLFLTGVSGIGKSFGVACLAARFGWPVITAKQFEQAFLDPDMTPQAWTNFIEGKDFFERPRTIVIDDIGTESLPLMKYGTPYNLMADVLDHRYYQSFFSHNKRTIVTCNLTDEQLRQRYGFRIDDRFNEIMAFAAVDGKTLR